MKFCRVQMSYHFLFAAVTVCGIIGFGGSAAAANRLTGAGSAGYQRGTEFDGLIIDSIEIDNRNVFDVLQPGYDNILFRTANNLHMVTRKAVIRQELLFDVGDPYSQDLAEETARNLRARYQLYDAWIETMHLDNGHLLVRVVTVDQWSFRLYLNFRREGNETDYEIGVEEKNLLGYNKSLNLNYVVLQRDVNYFRSIYRDDRLGGQALDLSLEYNGEPTDGVKRLTLNRPFYRLDQKFSFGCSVYDRNARRDYYNDEFLTAHWRRRGDDFSLMGYYRVGQYKRKIGVWVQYDYTYQEISEQAILRPEDSGLVVFPEDSVYHRFLTGVNLEWLDFAKLRRIDGFGYTEDFTLGQTVGVRIGRAMQPSFTDYLFDVVGFSLSSAHMIGSNLVLLGYDRDIVFKGGHESSRASAMSLRWYNNELPFVTLAVRFKYDSFWNSDGNGFLVLGGQSGIRGYDKFYKTGDRRLVSTIEGRFFPRLELLSVIFGGVAFMDFGGIWASGEPVKVSDVDYSFGVGLRISLEKVSRKELIRVDLARTELGQWELSAGTQQYF